MLYFVTVVDISSLIVGPDSLKRFFSSIEWSEASTILLARMLQSKQTGRRQMLTHKAGSIDNETQEHVGTNENTRMTEFPKKNRTNTQHTYESVIFGTH